MKKNKNFTRSLISMVAIIVIAIALIGCDGGIENPPEVVSTYPSNGSTGAALNGIITATFKESMNSASITGSTFTVSDGTANVAGSITYDVPNKKAIFAPTELLDPSTKYTATLTTGVKTSANIAMKVKKVWSFTTAAAGIGPGPIALGMAGNYVILAKTAITTVPSSVITGDVGISPAAESYMEGFSQTDATGYATSTQVIGHIFAADMAPPTNTNLTTATADMATAYNDAAGRITPDFTNLHAGDIGGKTLASGLYNWTTSVTTTTNSDVTINGGANDTWIFQVNGDLVLAANRRITLTGGAQAKNIFWQVSGEVILGTGSHFEGIVLSQTKITMQTGASMNGRLLAQSRIDLDQATVTEPTL